MLKSYKHIYFIGIGGIGMSAIARYFKAIGTDVSGYDKTPTQLTKELISEGINIHFEDNIRLIPNQIKELPHDIDNILIIYTPAIPKNHSEFIYFKENGFTIKKRAEVLGMITENSRTVAVAGTHGKTTTSSLITHILKSANLNPSSFLGGVTKNYNTNFLLNNNLYFDNQQSTINNLIVVEADEYDRSFLTLHPEMAVITSVDADHLDIYGNEQFVKESYSLFAQQVKSKLIVNKNIINKISIKSKTISYSIDDENADYFAREIKIENGFYHFEIVTPISIFTNLTLGLPGLHNVENSVAAVAIACEMGISEDNIRIALQSFLGVKRRFDYQIKSSKIIFIDDYAHHPEELKATVNSVKQMYPDKKITGIFQPHLYSRTRDFADGFAKSLDMLDECILMEIYPARELPIEGINSQMLLNKMKSIHKSILQKTDLVEEMSKKEIEVLLTMGAGDIDLFVEPLKEMLLKRI